ncbi:MAG TPA: ester cyclase [Gaiellaceae bacterium]|nr:ester cyclase [Gaiellaceae bacterium]
MSNANKETSLRLVEGFGQGRAEVIDELVAEDIVDHGKFEGMPEGREGVKALFNAIHGAFSDLEITVNRAFADGDLVVVHVTNSATMTGEFAGMPASGKHATWEAIHIDRIQDGKVAEHWVVQDQLGMLQQLGFVPTG